MLVSTKFCGFVASSIWDGRQKNSTSSQEGSLRLGLEELRCLPVESSLPRLADRLRREEMTPQPLEDGKAKDGDHREGQGSVRTRMGPFSTHK